jgi:hypothetical protein
MPITLRPINRRRFLSTAATAGAALAFPHSLLAKSRKSDPNYFALLSDIHLHADKTFLHDSPAGPANMWVNLQQACKELLASPSFPSAVLINGDIAFRHGLTEDYDTALAAMKPLREAGLTVHWALGNHDDRSNISKAALPDRALVPEVTPCSLANK